MFDDEKELNTPDAVDGTQADIPVESEDFVESSQEEVSFDNDQNVITQDDNKPAEDYSYDQVYTNQDTNQNFDNDSVGGAYYNYNNSYNNSSKNYNQGSPKNNKPSNTKIVVALIAVITIIAIITVIGIAMVTSKVVDDMDNKLGNDKETTVEDVTLYPEIDNTVDDVVTESNDTEGIVITDVSDVVEKCMPSIVSITSTTIVESNNWLEGWPFFEYGYGEEGKNYEEQVGAGSGIIVKQTETELLIVTNNHVIANADSLSVQFVNGKSIKGVTKSTDETADIAIVAIPLEDVDSETLEAIKIATLGSSDNTKVGEGVIAIGNALGYGQSVTTGVISAKEREITVDSQKMVVLQTDAAINGGNSGGALINSRGEVIGINVAKYSTSSYSGAASVEGMGFAIPVSQATDIINDLMSRETREEVPEEERGALGIMGFAVDATDAEMYSMPMGIFIKSIVEDGAAEKAGLKTSDVITEFDGQTVKTMESLQEKLQYYRAGEKVTITIHRKNVDKYEEMEVELTLSPKKVIEETETK